MTGFRPNSLLNTYSVTDDISDVPAEFKLCNILTFKSPTSDHFGSFGNSWSIFRFLVGECAAEIQGLKELGFFLEILTVFLQRIFGTKQFFWPRIPPFNTWLHNVLTRKEKATNFYLKSEQKQLIFAFKIVKQISTIAI